MNIKNELLKRKEEVDKELLSYFPQIDDLHKTIFESMRYSVDAGGKRLRPILMIEACRILDGDIRKATPFACAMEMIHTYSLIHDDLPAMDDDDYRRGKLTNHKVFGEGIAILAGDGLLNMAFEIMIKNVSNTRNNKNLINAMYEISKASGVNGMIGGQVVDLESEGNEVDKETLEFIHLNKTAAMISASVRAGALIGKASEDELNAISKYAENIGLAFQIVDDILDVVGDEKKLGKQIGSDKSNSKFTYPALYGIEKSRMMAQSLIDEALKALGSIDRDTDFLAELAKFFIYRDN